MRRVRPTATLVALGLAAAGAVAGTATAGQSLAASSARQPSAGRGYVPGSEVLNGGPIHGMILVSSNQSLDAVVGDIPRLAADGVNLVSIYVTKYIDSPTSNKIKDGRFTPSDSELEAAIDLAHENGMAVQLAPTVWTVSPYVWRGAFYPSNRSAFFDSYRSMMDHYAELAESNGVELLTVGSEYTTLERYGSQWRHVISDVRQRFSGLMTYMAVTQRIAKVKWWDALDFIGVSPYYSLSTASQPTYDEMRAAWLNRWMPFVRNISVKFGRPVLFNEIGYLSAEGAATAPYKSATKEPASQQVQADAYAALLDAAAAEPWLRGVTFFRWSPPVAAPIDRTFSPRDKLAECVMAQHWASPDAMQGPDGQPLACIGGTIAGSAGLSG
jgi:hypothetical protein